MRAGRGARLGALPVLLLLCAAGSSAGQKVLPGTLEQAKAAAEADKCAFATAHGLTTGLLGQLSGCKSPPPPGNSPPPAPPPAPVTKLVLAAGGIGGRVRGPLDSAELYDVSSGSWSTTGNLTATRWDHSMVSLPDGTALAAGGRTEGRIVLATAEVYDQVNQRWSRTPTNKTYARALAEMVLLDDGRALIAGGDLTDGIVQGTSEVYLPSTGAWVPQGNLSTPRAEFALAKLRDGRVLATGGRTQTSRTTSAEIYEPASGLWTLTGMMLNFRTNHQLVALPDGRALAAGGVTQDGSITATAETWNPATGLWSAVSNMTAPRANFGMELLPSGLVLAVAGEGNPGTSELFDPSTNTWTPTAGGLSDRRRLFELSVLLPDGRALVAGGLTTAGFDRGTELYSPQTTTWSGTGALNEERISFAMVNLA